MAEATCPKCGAPCTTDVKPRGGDYGWGTSDLERTSYRYASPPVAVQEERDAKDEAPNAEQFLPKLPDAGYLGDDVSYGYDSTDMRDYALEAVRAALSAMKGDQP